MKRVTAEDEYKKHTQIKKQDVQALMEWISKQPHLPKITELEAIFFLKCYEGSIELAKGLTENYYTCRTHSPEFFENRDPKNLVQDMDVVLYYPLPKPNDADCPRAIYISFVDSNPAKFNVNEQYKIVYMIFDLWLLQEGAATGHQLILDMKGLQFAHIAKTNLTTLKKALYYLQEAIPVKTIYVHIVNVLPIANKVMAFYKPFLRKELQEKIIFHSENLDTLYKYVPKVSLPKHLGGEGLTLKEMHDQMKENLLNNADFFEEDEQFKRVDESKRPGKPKTVNDLFGIEGSFKKLDID